MNRLSVHRDIEQERLADHLAGGRAQRHFFAHRVRHLKRCGPDALLLASRMCRIDNPDSLWEITIHALPPALDQFPAELFFDSDLNWHQRHLGLPGHVASASVAMSGRVLRVVAYVSDLVQRSSRRPEYRSAIDKHFKGWSLWLLNAVVDFAREHGCTEVLSATSDLVLAHTDPARSVQPQLYRRVYDDTIVRWFHASRQDQWWLLNVADNLGNVVAPRPGTMDLGDERIICVSHDIEGGLGHITADPALSERAAATAITSLEAMLKCERDSGVKATYNVVGCMLPDVRERIELDGHSVGFHSYDHSIDRMWPLSRTLRRIRRRVSHRSRGPIDQLSGCREVDYRIRGYRPPQSRITRDLNDVDLCLHNFEWLASSQHSLRVKVPKLHRRVVRIPIYTDDHPLYRRDISWPEWQSHVLARASSRPFTAVSLHDCYAHLWIDRYPEFLERLKTIARLVTFDEVASRMFLSTAS